MEYTFNGSTAAYSVAFVRESRGGQDVPSMNGFPAWANVDAWRLDKINVMYGAAVVRTYDLTHSTVSGTSGSYSYVTDVLTSVVTSSTLNNGATAPKVSFTYANQNNKSGSLWPYPRLATVNNGWGATATFTYQNDGRTATDSWYNWRVSQLDIADGISANGATDMRTAFAYSSPCYNDKPVNGGGLGWCNSQNKGDLVGYAQNTVTTRDPNNANAALAISVHNFHTDEKRSGKEYEVQNKDAAGTTILSQTNTTYTVLTGNMPPKVYYAVMESQENKILKDGVLVLVNRTEFDYDPNTGNLTSKKEYNTSGTAELFSNGFESQNFSSWTSSATNGGTLSVTALARLNEEFGMQALISSGGGPIYFVEQSGSVVVEAENYTGTVAGYSSAAGSSWQSVTNPTGYVGAGAMQALPNSGVNTWLEDNGPALTYQINFQTAGTYYVYLRGYAPANTDDSVHVGLDGVATTTSAGQGLTGFSASGFTWRKLVNGVAATVNVASPGVHTFNLWMREDGVVIDRIWLSTASNAVSSGSTSTGPAESGTSGGTGAAQYVESNTPVNLAQYRAKFWFDPNTVTIPGGTAA
ncbi:MAG: hypothetical protein AAB217_19470, partial [Chloroflexota bacterium]